VRVVGLGHPGDDRTVRCDVRDAPCLQAALEGIDLVYNLAAVHGLTRTHTTQEYESVNVDGARNVCQAASRCGVAGLVLVSTAYVYGPGPIFTEDSPLNPEGDYGRTKLEAENICRQWTSEDAGRALVIVRPTVVFGPGGQGSADRFIRHVAGPDFTHFGEAANRRSMAYVENLAAFLAFVADQVPGERLFNYADVPDLTVAEIVTIVREALGLPPAPKRSLAGGYASTLAATLRARLAGQPAPPAHTMRAMLRQLSLERRLDASRAHATGFVPPVPLREALAATARADARWVALLSRARA